MSDISHIEKIRYYSVKFLSLIKLKINYFLKLFLVHLFKIIIVIFFLKFIIKYIPDSIKIEIRLKLLRYPTLIKFLRNIFFLSKEDKESTKGYIFYFSKFFLKIIFLPLLNLILKNPVNRTIVYNELKSKPNLKIKIEQILGNQMKINYLSHNLKNKSILVSEEFDLSLDTQEVYQGMRSAFTYETNY
ncbi:MAG TPA: hypothetical protein VGH95_02580 [Candidatus Aquirickettsiella sp.]|jgi:hypothetical protein